MIDMLMRSFNRGDGEYLEYIDNLSYDYGNEIDWFIENTKNCRVADVVGADGPVGYYVMQTHSKKSLEIVRFAIAPAYRRQGIGTLMIDDILSEGWRYNRVITQINERNLVGQQFLKANYFKCIRILKESEEPYYLFVKDIGVPQP